MSDQEAVVVFLLLLGMGAYLYALVGKWKS